MSRHFNPAFVFALGCFFSGLMVSCSSGQIREWTNRDGKVIQAQFAELDSTTNEIVLDKDGRKYEFSFSLLF